MSRKLLASVAALTPLAALTAVGTFALFTDQEALGNNLFNTGKIDLSLGTSSALLTASAMMPGDSVGPTALTVSNAAGSSALRYAVSVATSTTDSPSKNLDQALQLVVKAADVGGGCTAFTGTQLYSGDLAATSSAGKVIGNAASGNDTGDRALGVNGTETLCFKVSLPSSAGNSVASANTTATFTFTAEQTANN
jgi:predicted ribosomally synthesized peptide with SipW-like signal peptide